MSMSMLDVGQLIINGRSVAKAYADLTAATTSLTMTETITGASTLSLTIEDPKRVFINSGLATELVTMVIDGAGFELAGVQKNGSQVQLELEDMAAAALRRRRGYRKAAAGTVSRAAFCRMLIGEEKWITVVTAPGAVAKVELARGSADTTASTSKTEQENTWDAVSRIAGEIGWRVYAYRKQLIIGPDSWLMTRGSSYALSEDSPGVDSIDFEWDTGKPAATATVMARAGTNKALTPGTKVTLSKLGPANGDWLVDSINRTAGDSAVSVELVRMSPTLPEPTDSGSAAATSTVGNLGEGGFGTELNALQSVPAAAAAKNPLVERWVQIAVGLRGAPYVYGAAGPKGFDCSGFVQYTAGAVGVRVPRTVNTILAACQKAQTTMSVQQGIGTRGAVMFRRGEGTGGHVAISLGNGYTIEARGKAYGCGVFGIAKRNWTHSAFLPGLTTTPAQW